MGIKAEKTIEQKKEITKFTTVASGAVQFPPLFHGGIFAILDAGDHHRELEVINAQKKCYAYARDAGFNTAGTSAVAMNLDTKVIRFVAIATDIVTGDVGIMLNGNIKTRGPRTEIESMLSDLTDFSREQNRLFA